MSRWKKHPEVPVNRRQLVGRALVILLAPAFFVWLSLGWVQHRHFDVAKGDCRFKFLCVDLITYTEDKGYPWVALQTTRNIQLKASHNWQYKGLAEDYVLWIGITGLALWLRGGVATNKKAPITEG